MPENRCALVAIIGRPNVGKSTLMNHLLGQKLSITSRKPQTTRQQILGVRTEGDIQLIFIDTPGLHSGQSKAIHQATTVPEITRCTATTGTEPCALEYGCFSVLSENFAQLPPDS